MQQQHDETIIHDVWLPLVERALTKQLNDLVTQLTWSEKIATVQILTNQIKVPTKHIKLELIRNTNDKLHAVFGLATFLPKEALTEIAIQLLEEPRDQNE